MTQESLKKYKSYLKNSDLKDVIIVSEPQEIGEAISSLKAQYDINIEKICLIRAFDMSLTENAPKSFNYKDYSIMKARMASITCPIVGVIMAIGIIIIAIMFKEPLVLLGLIISALLIGAGPLFYFISKN